MLEETGLTIGHVRFLTATNDVMQMEGKHYVTLFVGCKIEGRVKRPQVSLVYVAQSLAMAI